MAAAQNLHGASYRDTYVPLRPPSPPLQGHKNGGSWTPARADSIAFEEFASRLAVTDVIYLGEQHRTRAHIEAAITVLEVLQQRQRLPILGLEMFSWDGQAALDRYLLDTTPAKMQFLQEARWQENWGGDYEEYEPLVRLPDDTICRIIALNPPRPLVRKIAREGLRPEALDAEMGRWGMRGEQFVQDAAYQDTILEQLRACHRGLPPDAYQRMYEASVFRDEGMAKTISDAAARLPGSRPDRQLYRRGAHPVPVTGPEPGARRRPRASTDHCLPGCNRPRPRHRTFRPAAQASHRRLSVAHSAKSARPLSAMSLEHNRVLQTCAVLDQ